jgi:hypothetical protein
MWPDSRLMINTSWVDEFLVSEREFLDKVVEEAEKPGHEWALNHLPQYFYVEDVGGPTAKSVREFLNEEYTYRNIG